MINNQKRYLYIFVSLFFLLTSCLSGLKPLPSDVKDLTMSVSVPLGSFDVQRIITTPGIPYPRPNTPPWAMFDALYFNDTVAAALYTIYDKASAVNSIAFRVYLVNDFPIGCTASFHFTDIGYSDIFSIDSVDVPGGSILYNGNVINAGRNKLTLTLNNDQIDSLRNVEYLIINVKMKIADGNTYDFQFYDNFKLTCQIGAQVNFTLNDL
jgi:hypothetical protein